MTAPTTTGSTSSASGFSAEERLAELDRQLDEFERRAGLPELATGDTEAMRLLGLTGDALRRLSADECGEAAVELARFGLHLQRVVNREQSHVKWADENIRVLVAPNLSKVPGYSLDERKLRATQLDGRAVQLDALRVRAELQAGRLSYLAVRAEMMSKCFLELQQTRRGRRD